MNLPRYPNYKDSGVEWLGQVPEHWDVCSLKRIVSMKSGESITAESIDGIGEYQVFGGNGLRGYTSAFTHDGNYVLVGRQGALCGNINYASGKFWASEHAVVAKPVKRVNHVWLGEMLRTMNLNQYSVAAAQPGLSVDLIERIGIGLPPVDEQTQIAAFLDRETAKIDGLVVEQRRLMELLREKRQAVISHAVTRGLSPDAPMKPSGIEWLGEVPAHWTVPRLAYHATIENGTTPSRENSDYWLDGNVPWLSSGEVNQYRIMEANEFITQEALDKCSLRLLPKGAVVVGMIGQGRTRGLAATLEIDACINQNLAAIIPSKNVLSDYLLYIFQSAYAYLREFGRGGNQAALNCEILSAMKLPLPPVEEQLHICKHLGIRLKEFDTLTAEAQRAINLLQERRTVLISAAVTGQIDVRGQLKVAVRIDVPVEVAA